MNRTPVTLSPHEIPDEFIDLLHGARVYDSSCSRLAQVYFIDRDAGYYLKSAPPGTLKTEAEMTRFYHDKGLSAQVLSYITTHDRDWMLSSRVPGEDCTHRQYLDDPKRLSETLALRLRMLHELPYDGCPVQDRNSPMTAALFRTG